MVSVRRIAGCWAIFAAIGATCTFLGAADQAPARQSQNSKPPQAHRETAYELPPGLAADLQRNPPPCSLNGNPNSASTECRQTFAAEQGVAEARRAADYAFGSVVIAASQAVLLLGQILALVVTIRQSRSATKAAIKSVAAAQRSAKAAEAALEKADAALLHAQDASTEAIAEAKAANQISRDAIEADSRPWLRVDVRLNTFNFTPTGGAHLGLDIEIMNFGRSPAMNVFPDFRITTFDKMKVVQAEISQRAKDWPAHTVIGKTIFPSGTPVNFPIQTELQSAELDQIFEGTGIENLFPIMVVGSLIYLSPNRTSHETGFALDLLKFVNGQPPPLVLTRGEPLDNVVVFLRESLISHPIT